MFRAKRSRRRSQSGRTPRGPLAEVGLRETRFSPLGRPVVLVPGEAVRTAIVDLPIRSATKRRAAAPFALEESIGAPLDSVQVVLGKPVAPGRYLAAIADRKQIDDWRQALGRAQRRGAVLIPDYLMLRPPDEEGCWTVHRRGERILARLPDGTGFAADSDAFHLAWRLAAMPRLHASGDALPAEFEKALVTRRPRPLPPDPRFAGLNLAAEEESMSSETAAWTWARAAAAIVLLGAGGHTAIGYAELHVLETEARKRQGVVAALLADVAPGEGSVAEVIARMDAASASAQHRGFLDTFSETAKAFRGFRSDVTIDALSYEDESGRLDLDIVIADLTLLQRLERTLEESVLAPSVGAATARDGAAEARVTVRLEERRQ